MGRQNEYSDLEIAEAATALGKFNDSFQLGAEQLYIEWALKKFDNLFTGKVLIEENKAYARERIAELYVNPIYKAILTPEENTQRYKKELHFLQATILPSSRVPLFLKKLLIDNYRSNLHFGEFKFVKPITDDKARKVLENEIYKLESEYITDQADNLPPSKIPNHISETLFASQFWSKSLKRLLLFYYPEKDRSALHEISDTPEFLHMGESEFSRRHTDYRIIGMYLVLSEHFNLPAKIAEGNKMLPYLHRVTIELIAEKLGEKPSAIEEDLKRIFDHRPPK